MVKLDIIDDSLSTSQATSAKHGVGNLAEAGIDGESQVVVRLSLANSGCKLWNGRRLSVLYGFSNSGASLRSQVRMAGRLTALSSNDPEGLTVIQSEPVNVAGTYIHAWLDVEEDLYVDDLVTPEEERDQMVIAVEIIKVACSTPGSEDFNNQDVFTTSSTTTTAAPVVEFSYVPAEAIITWNEGENTGLSGDLAYFKANANLNLVTYLATLADNNITSLTLGNQLPSLTNIDLATSGGTLTALDAAGCANLLEIDLYTWSCTRVSYLNVTGCTSLAKLWVDVNPLTDIIGFSTLSGSLRDLSISGNQLTWSSLDLTQFSKLGTEYLLDSGVWLRDIAGLETLNVSGLTAMLSLYVDNSASLAQINLTGCTGLKTLTLTTAAILSVDGIVGLTGCTNLTSLNLQNLPALTSFPLTAFTELTTLTLGGTSIEELDLTGLTKLVSLSINGLVETLDLTGLTELANVYVSSCPNLVSLDLSGLTSLTYTATTSNPQLASINVAGCINLGGAGFADNALPTSQVDALLATMAAFEHTPEGTKVLDLNDNEEPITMGVPTGGLNNPDLLTLVSKGWSVNINT